MSYPPPHQASIGKLPFAWTQPTIPPFFGAGLGFGSSTFFTVHQSVTGKQSNLAMIRRAHRYMWEKDSSGTMQLYTLSYQWKGGMNWMQLKKKLNDMFMDNSRDLNIIQRIGSAIRHLVPVRSGKLLDSILNTMMISRYRFYRTRFWALFEFMWPGDRPIPIPTPKHRPPSKGYAQYYRPVNVIPNVHLLYRTPAGNARYLLNDPSALGDPTKDINIMARQFLFEDYADIFNDLTIILHVKKNIDSGETQIIPLTYP